MVIKLVMILLIPLLASCTMIRFDQAPESEAHVTVMPATQTSVMSATEGQWSDRAQRADGDAQESGDTSAEQTATAVPTVSIPLTGASPAAAAAGVERYFEGEVALPEVIPDEVLPSPEETDTGKKSKDK